MLRSLFFCPEEGPSLLDNIPVFLYVLTSER